MPGKKIENGAITLLSEEDAKRYAGQYVCVPEFNSRTVVAADENPKKALQTARDAGYKEPVTFYVPRVGEIFLFDFVDETEEFLVRIKA